MEDGTVVGVEDPGSEGSNGGVRKAAGGGEISKSGGESREAEGEGGTVPVRAGAGEGHRVMLASTWQLSGKPYTLAMFTPAGARGSHVRQNHLTVAIGPVKVLHILKFIATVGTGRHHRRGVDIHLARYIQASRRSRRTEARRLCTHRAHCCCCHSQYHQSRHHHPCVPGSRARHLGNRLIDGLQVFQSIPTCWL